MTWIGVIVICTSLSCRDYTWPEPLPSLGACQNGLMLIAPQILKDGERLDRIKCRPHVDEGWWG